MSELTELKRIIEGAILASNPRSQSTILVALYCESPTRSEIRDAIAEIEADCESRGSS